MKSTRMWIVLVFAFGLQQNYAGTVLGTTGMKCYSTNYQNPTATTMSVYGDWIENIEEVLGGNSEGITTTILGKYNGAQNNSGPFAGRGRVDLNIATSNATPREARITLYNKPDPLNLGRGDMYTIYITVVPKPTVTSVSSPTPSDPFNNIVVTLTGTGLQNAKDPAVGTIVRDNTIPYITVGGDAHITSVRILSSSSTSIQAQIFFSALVQDVTANLTLGSENECVPLGVRGVPRLETRVRVKSSNIKNYVKSITFPNGNTFDKNSIGTIRVNLLFPAPQSGGTTIRLAGRDFNLGGKVLNEGSRTVFFKLVPANAFVAVPNGTPINATGFTRVDANVGDDLIAITFKVADCLGGVPGTTNAVKIQTWMHNTNTLLPPEFVEKTFQVRCTQ